MIVPMSQHDRNDIQELHAWVSGWVQGVGFRYFVIDNALALGLRGYVRNESNGDVEVVAQGTHTALERLLTLLRRGPSAAQVRDVRVNWGQPTEHFSGFNIRFSVPSSGSRWLLQPPE
jgi:acylphosphatase